MEINWVQILIDILMVVFGFLVWYLKTKTTLLQQAEDAINSAEKAYESVAKAGNEKFEFCVEILYNYVPAPLKIFITRDMIAGIVQTAFNSMANYAEQQLDKIVGKVKGE